MLAERSFRSRPWFPRSLSSVLVLGLGLATLGVGAPAAVSAEADQPVRVAIAIPLVVRPSTTAFITPEELTAYTAPEGLLTRQLDAVEGRPVAIGIDPRIIVSIRILGSSAPASAIDWLARLEAVPNETFRLGYADVDPTIATQAGGGGLLEPQSFDFAIDASRFAAATTATPDPTTTPADGAAPTLPSSDELVVWPYTLTGLAWPQDDTLTAAGLAAITSAGYSSVIASSTNLTRAETAGATSEVDGTRLLVSDSEVSTALRAAVGSIGIEQWAPAAARLVTQVAAAGATQSAPVATVFATLDREVPLDSTRVGQTIDYLEADPTVDLVSLGAAMSVGPTAAALVDEAQDGERIALTRQLLDAEAAEQRFASVAADPARITAERRLDLLAVLSVAWFASPEDWTEAAHGFLTDSSALRSSVQLVASGTLNLVADNGQRLPITVRNDLDQPVTAYVTVRPESALLAVDDPRVAITLDANSQEKVNVPVHSLSNGVVDVGITLSSVTGVELGTPISTEVNVVAGWETPIVVIGAILVLLVFVVGVVRTVLRRRRARTDEVAEA